MKFLLGFYTLIMFSLPIIGCFVPEIKAYMHNTMLHTGAISVLFYFVIILLSDIKDLEQRITVLEKSLFKMGKD